MELPAEPLTAAPLREAVHRLGEHLRRLFDAVADMRRFAPAQIASVTVPVEPCDPLLWLAGLPPRTSVYWADRDGGFECAGFEAATVARCEGRDPWYLWRGLRRLLSERFPSVRFFGGIRFDPHREAAPEWRSFGTGTFIVPRFFLQRTGNRFTLGCNIVPVGDRGRRVEILEALEAVFRNPRAGAHAVAACRSRADVPTRAAWEEIVEKVLECFARGGLQKIVLARRSSLRFEQAVNPYSLLAKLRSVASGCFHFAFRLQARGPVFLGASPERLYRRLGNRLWSESVAGTRPRGSDRLSDAALRQELLASSKERREQLFVVEALKEALTSLCKEVVFDRDPQVAKLQDVQHLVTRFSGTLLPGVCDERLAASLHPTPAVCGVPSEEARRWICSLEGFDRGWYTGPIGWFSTEATELAVALRCALLQGRTIHLYAGAGLVPGSTAQQEWDEIEQKIDWFQGAVSDHGDSPPTPQQPVGDVDR